MDYSIQAEVERRAQNLAMAKAVAKAYPDAQVCWLDETRCVFVSQSVKATRVTTLVVDGRFVLAAYGRVTVGDDLVSVFLGNAFGEVATGYVDNDRMGEAERAALIALVKP